MVFIAGVCGVTSEGGHAVGTPSVSSGQRRREWRRLTKKIEGIIQTNLYECTFVLLVAYLVR